MGAHTTPSIPAWLGKRTSKTDKAICCGPFLGDCMCAFDAEQPGHLLAIELLQNCDYIQLPKERSKKIWRTVHTNHRPSPEASSKTRNLAISTICQIVLFAFTGYLVGDRSTQLNDMQTQRAVQSSHLFASLFIRVELLISKSLITPDPTLRWHKNLIKNARNAISRASELSQRNDDCSGYYAKNGQTCNSMPPNDARALGCPPRTKGPGALITNTLMGATVDGFSDKKQFSVQITSFIPVTFLVTAGD